MRNSGSVSYSFYFDISVDRFHAHLTFQISRFNSESVVTEFIKIKSKADNNRKLGMNTGEIFRDNCVECSYDSKFSAVFLREIAKCKKF